MKTREKQDAQPPRWATELLEWYCRPELLEDLAGDLHEHFERHRLAKGKKKARLLYILNVLKFLRPYTVRKMKLPPVFNQWIMIGSYVKTSGRNIFRNKLFSAINIIGLAVSMSVALLVTAFVADLTSYDQFHENRDRIYRLISHEQRSGQGIENVASTSVIAGKKIQETFTGVESVTIIRNGFSGDALIGEALHTVGGFYADASFLTTFSFTLLQGDLKTALKEPHSIVLTEKCAARLFGTPLALGKSLKLDTINYFVTGILENVPKFSHLKFESLISFSSLDSKMSDGDGEFLSWTSIYSNYVYLLLPENADPTGIERQLKLLSAENVHADNRKTVTLSLQAMNDIVLGQKLHNQLGGVINPIAVIILGGLACVIILSACFNYTNLSIARSLRRSREVGIRKVIGAMRGHVFGQFITESIIISLFSLSFAFILFLLLRNQFLSLHSFLENRSSLELSVPLVGWFLVIALVIGLGAGFLPALFFSRINATKVLKDATSLRLFRHVNMRKALIVVQYVFSLIFISVTLIGYNQYKGFLKFDLGFKTENILNIWLNGANGDHLTKELAEIPEIEGISRSRIVTSLGSIYGTQMKYPRTNDSSSIWLNDVDEHYLPLHGHTFIAGRNFNPRPDNTPKSEAIINERALHRFKIGGGDPHKALGEEIIVGDNKLTIVGVLEDFHYETVEDGIEPTVLTCGVPKTAGFVNVKVNTKDLPAALARIGAAWKKIDPNHPLTAKFYDDQILEAYSMFSVMIRVVGFLAFLAVCISSMGLFGMVVFTTETKMKEISIRKVLGAGERKLVFLLSKGFVVLLLFSAVVALPATWLLFDKVILSNFVYHQPLEVTQLLISLLIVMAIALTMIGSQTIRVARSNPAEVLKNE